MIFGIYPGGPVGGDAGLVAGISDDPERIEACLDRLQGNAPVFVVRAYERFADSGRPLPWPPCAPANYERYARPNRPLDLVLMFQSGSGDVEGFKAFVRDRVERHARRLYCVQITEEPNFTSGPPVVDGPYPEVRRALAAGVEQAKRALERAGRPEVLVGFNATPTFGPEAEFWQGLRTVAGPALAECVDYVGIDFFPDVFGPQPEVGQAARLVLETMRREWLPAAGLTDRVEIHVTENGWPTGPERSFEDQAARIESIVRTVHEVRDELNVRRYTMFDLRDADSRSPERESDIFYHFGLTLDDYRPKPAFETYRALIAELGGGIGQASPESL